MDATDAAPDARLPPRLRLAVALAAGAWFALALHFAFARLHTVHHRTFDLALYARMAWGLVRGDGSDPIVGGSFLGAHVAWVLYPLGLLGELFGTVRVLLVAQAFALAVAAWPLARLGHRRAGFIGAMAATFAWLLYPNLFHVATYEFHPGTLAVWPLCAALDAFDRRQPRALAWCCAAMVACRASLALVTVFVGVAAVARPGALRRAGAGIVLASIAYLALSWLVLRPAFAGGAATSLDAHFGAWGGSPFGVIGTLLHDPARVVAHFSTPARLAYLPALLGPLALLPLLAPSWLVVALPTLGVNLLSEFPTATAMYSHYLTPAVPALVVAAVDGAAWLARRVPSTAPAPARHGVWTALGLCALGGSVVAGGAPWSRDFPGDDFTRDAHTVERERILAGIPAGASVQAPDALLPHLALRRRVYRAPPPERGTDHVVLDVSHRQRYAHSEDLLRTVEEPGVRAWLARDDHHVVRAEPTLVLLARGRVTHDARVGPYLVPPAHRAPVPDAPAADANTVRLAACLSVTHAHLADRVLAIDFLAHAACPADLALRLGAGARPRRVELLFDGVLSPAHLRAGDRVRSRHALSAGEHRAITRRGLRLGLLRSSGPPPDPSDPVSVKVPLP